MNEQTSSSKNPEGFKFERLASIDVLRRFDMLFLVGLGEVLRRLFKAINPDGLQNIQYQLSHADWIGFTAWDIIMPLFLFTAGLSTLLPPICCTRFVHWTGWQGIGSTDWNNTWTHFFRSACRCVSLAFFFSSSVICTNIRYS